MSYVVEIIRVNGDDTVPIAPEEFRHIVESDPALEMLPAGPEYNPDVMAAKWTQHPRNKEALLCFASGVIDVTTPDDHILIKMRQVAKSLEARVRGEEGEFLDDIEINPVDPGCFVVLLATVAVLLGWAWSALAGSM